MTAASSCSSDKRDAILEGAIAEFLKQGYAAASMDRIASTAGVSKATIYSHFQSKDRLFIAIVDRLVLSKFADLLAPEQVTQHLNDPPEQLLRHLASTMLQVPRQDPEYVGFIRIVIAESERFPDLAQTFLRELPAIALESLSHYFTHCPHLALPDPEATARIFLGAIAHYIITQYVLYGADILPLTETRLIDTLIAMITASGAKPL
ncbi:TetR/AcrR family transcriptional regulator [Spirulina subsalsa FACHB-351]|uniref:TetR/AcrR family transcriptional regulator n=1 Tax=Spirulina subsalsa FACHB-351 TaxID=234711 RepID=A0ABT3L2F1_9CYAN|nr:TetR/AcrR family transcriptional regulator [Spirulina subsalsa]MCW6035692.1 TetR/AcrR family transcriptional regulator [Spirulina subsalsa FACHB-351]